MRPSEFKLPATGKKRWGHRTHTTKGGYIRKLNKIGYFDKLVERERLKYEGKQKQKAKK